MYEENEIKSEYHQVGVQFHCDGTTLVAVEQPYKGGCGDCYCNKEDRELLCKQLLCTKQSRPDGKEVTFKEVIR